MDNYYPAHTDEVKYLPKRQADEFAEYLFRSGMSPVPSYVKRGHTAGVELKTGQIDSPTKPHWSSQTLTWGQAG